MGYKAIIYDLSLATIAYRHILSFPVGQGVLCRVGVFCCVWLVH